MVKPEPGLEAAVRSLYARLFKPITLDKLHQIEEGMLVDQHHFWKMAYLDGKGGLDVHRNGLVWVTEMLSRPKPDFDYIKGYLLQLAEHSMEWQDKLENGAYAKGYLRGFMDGNGVRKDRDDTDLT